MATRHISTRTRFEIFKRDGFRCIYCGATPVQKALHVDHVLALANGGDNRPSNLVTACSDCNLGKAAVPLSRKPLGARTLKQSDRDHAKQILEFLALQRRLESARSKAVDAVAARWEQLVGPMTQAMYDRLEGILKDWPPEPVDHAIRITARKLGTPGEKFVPHIAVNQAKYFQGILRNWREGRR